MVNIESSFHEKCTPFIVAYEVGISTMSCLTLNIGRRKVN